jgi:hypothetical protein
MSKKNDLRLQREGTVINSISKKQEKRLGNKSKWVKPLKQAPITKRHLNLT